jgi:hypothetical protein
MDTLEAGDCAVDRKMTGHDRCMIDTMSLELELYGQVRSPSVLDHVKRLDEDMRIRSMAHFGGPRALSS